MPLQISEKWASGAGTIGQNNADEISADVWGDPNPQTDNADDPLTIIRFAFQHFAVISEFGNVFSDFDRVRVAPGRWTVTAKYKSSTDTRQTNDASFSFSTGGGKKHIYTSIFTVSRTQRNGVPGAPNDHQGSINVTKDGVGGVDIYDRAFKFKTTFYVDPANMTENYVRQLYNSMTCANSDPVTMNIDGIVIEFQPGELLLVDGSGQKRRGFGDWEIGLSWEASPNLYNVEVGMSSNGQPALTIPAIRGQDYFWIEYYDAADVNGLVKIPLSGYVEQVYLYVPLSGILPTSAFGVTNSQPWTNIGNFTGGGFLE